MGATYYSHLLDKFYKSKEELLKDEEAYKATIPETDPDRANSQMILIDQWKQIREYEAEIESLTKKLTKLRQQHTKSCRDYSRKYGQFEIDIDKDGNPDIKEKSNILTISHYLDDFED